LSIILDHDETSLGLTYRRFLTEAELPSCGLFRGELDLFSYVLGFDETEDERSSDGSRDEKATFAQFFSSFSLLLM
jgi:hypothetical protein